MNIGSDEITSFTQALIHVNEYEYMDFTFILRITSKRSYASNITIVKLMKINDI